jgi:hypothetical protein
MFLIICSPHMICPFITLCQVAEIPERGKVRNAEWSYTEVLRSWISGTMESIGSVGSGLGFNL